MFTVSLCRSSAWRKDAIPLRKSSKTLVAPRVLHFLTPLTRRSISINVVYYPPYVGLYCGNAGTHPSPTTNPSAQYCYHCIIVVVIRVVRYCLCQCDRLGWEREQPYTYLV